LIDEGAPFVWGRAGDKLAHVRSRRQRAKNIEVNPADELFVPGRWGRRDIQVGKLGVDFAVDDILRERGKPLWCR